jgi:hypothetical protein
MGTVKNKALLIVSAIVLTAAVLGAATTGTLSGVTGEPQNANIGSTADEPVFAWHFVLRPMAMPDAKRMVDAAESAGFNTIVVQLASGLDLESFPLAPSEGAWGKEELGEWVAYARSRGINVIPEIKLLSKQKKFFRNSRPGLMFNAETYDPRNEEVYKVVFRLIDDLISIMKPTAIHIGHDEVAGFKESSAKKYLHEGEKILPADLFLMDILKVHDFLSSRDVETWMWGDMLVSPDEFPSMEPRHLHGTVPGYGKVLRDQLPRDVVIADWHYKQDNAEFPTLAVLRDEGFRVIGTTFRNKKTIRQFSRYASKHGAYGMMATSWFYVGRGDWDTVNQIMTISGETFQKDFLHSE